MPSPVGLLTGVFRSKNASAVDQGVAVCVRSTTHPLPGKTRLAENPLWPAPRLRPSCEGRPLTPIFLREKVGEVITLPLRLALRGVSCGLAVRRYTNIQIFRIPDNRLQLGGRSLTPC
jgi:hypothetical protein